MKDELRARLDHNLTWHPPRTEAIGRRLDAFRSVALDFGHYVIDAVPEGRELHLALTALEETTMWAVAGIARNQQDLPAS